MVKMFRGASYHNIDPKGRIIIPARFRDVIKASGVDGVMITRLDNCLFAYTHDQWSKLEQKILDLPEKSDDTRRFQRLFIGAAHDCKCDAQGRVLIPPFLKQYAGLEKEIVLVGVPGRFEIWSRENWDLENERMQENLSSEQMRKVVAQLGI
jgi:MraZ protein